MRKKETLLDKLAKQYTEEEISLLLKQSKKKPPKELIRKYDGTDARILVFGDTHIGHEKYDSGLMKSMSEEANKWGCDFAMCTGDICEGWYTNRPGHMFELTHMGLDQQLEYAVDQLKQLEMPLPILTKTMKITWTISAILKMGII